MERSNQPPNTECCRKEGQASVAASEASQTTFWKRTQGTSQAISGNRTPLKPSSLETVQHAGGDAVASAEPNTEAAASGEAAGDLPGSKRMAREERADGNLGGPEKPRRANCGSQSGRSVQRQEECANADPGVRSVHSSSRQAGEGTDTTTQPAQDSRAVRTTAQSRLYRYADDFVCCFDYRHEAEAFEQAAKGRLAKFGLELALDKTQTLRFGRNGGGYNGRFDFLGFEFRWEKSRKGHAIVKRRSSRKKLRGAVERFSEWIGEHRHLKLKLLMKTVAQKHQGHWNYYGIIGNSESLSDYRTLTLRVLFKKLNRRSQRRSYTWRSFNRLLQRFGVPLPRIMEKASSTELRSKPEWRAGQVAGVNLFGHHFAASRA